MVRRRRPEVRAGLVNVVEAAQEFQGYLPRLSETLDHRWVREGHPPAGLPSDRPDSSEALLKASVCFSAISVHNSKFGLRPCPVTDAQSNCPTPDLAEVRKGSGAEARVTPESRP
jgi:hypothetical protein